MNGQRDSCRRLCLLVRGAVQGVGFRPFVYRLATEHKLGGWIQNSPQGVHIEVEGSSEHLDSFLEQFERDARSLGFVLRVEPTRLLDAAGYAGFEIRESSQDGVRAAWIMPDLATCTECRRELFEKRHDRAMIIVSHEAHNIRDYCARACVLHHGMLREYPDVDAAYTAYNQL